MATTKNRLNISLPPDVDRALSDISKRDKTPRATKAAELLRLALEIEEDRVWGELASKRDVKGVRFLSHEEAWKKFRSK
jgi:cell division protein FtsX